LGLQTGVADQNLAFAWAGLLTRHRGLRSISGLSASVFPAAAPVQGLHGTIRAALPLLNGPQPPALVTLEWRDRKTT
jgi:hypothetical protein